MELLRRRLHSRCQHSVSSVPQNHTPACLSNHRSLSTATPHHTRPCRTSAWRSHTISVRGRRQPGFPWTTRHTSPPHCSTLGHSHRLAARPGTLRFGITSDRSTSSGYLNPVKQEPYTDPYVRFCERAESRPRNPDSPYSITPRDFGRLAGIVLWHCCSGRREHFCRTRVGPAAGIAARTGL